MPTATLCTDEFQALGRAEAEALGMGSLPIVVLPHPVGGIQPDEARSRALGVLEDVLEALTADTRRLAERYRGHYVDARGVFRAKPLFSVSAGRG